MNLLLAHRVAALGGDNLIDKYLERHRLLSGKQIKPLRNSVDKPLKNLMI